MLMANKILPRRLGPYRLIQLMSFASIYALFLQVVHLQLQRHKRYQGEHDGNDLPDMSQLVHANYQRRVHKQLTLTGIQGELMGGNEAEGILQEFQNIQPESVNNSANHHKMTLLYNRVPKTGSETLILLLRDLAVRNVFTLYRDKARAFERISLNETEQKKEVQMIDCLQPPAVYVRHLCYLNFTTFKKTQPLYVNMVRDPVERVISWHYYVRSSWYILNRQRRFPNLAPPPAAWLLKDYETCVLKSDAECSYIEGKKVHSFAQLTNFFCGHENVCREFNTAAALQKAKENVERYYSVVGVLEDLGTTLTVMQHYIPRFFRGAKDLYGNNVSRYSKVNWNALKPFVPERIKEIVRKNFTREIEFYDFCKRRLYMQYSALKLTETEPYIL